MKEEISKRCASEDSSVGTIGSTSIVTTVGTRVTGAPSIRRQTPRLVLASAGGIASGSYIAKKLGVSVRTVRDRLRHNGNSVVKLGGGYFALTGADIAPVLVFAERKTLQVGGKISVTELAEKVMQEYPHGSVLAIRGWLAQDPGRLCCVDGTITLIKRDTF